MFRKSQEVSYKAPTLEDSESWVWIPISNSKSRRSIISVTTTAYSTLEVKVTDWVSGFSGMASHTLLFYNGLHKGKVFLITAWLMSETSHILMRLIDIGMGVYHGELVVTSRGIPYKTFI